MRTFACFFLFAASAIFAAASWAQSAEAAAAAPPDTIAEAEETPLVELKVDTAFAYCALEMTGSYDQHEAAITRLYQEAMNQGLYGGMPFGIYFNNPSNAPVEKLAWDVGFAVPAGSAPKPPLVLKKWDFTTMASLRYRGVFGGEEMNNAYGRLFQWIGENGYEPAGPLMEVFLNAPSPDESGALYGAVEIIVPIRKASPPPAKAE